MEREARFHFEMFSVRPVSVSLVSSRFPSLFLTGFVFSRCYFPFLSFSFVFACVLALACVCVCVCVFLCVGRAGPAAGRPDQSGRLCRQTKSCVCVRACVRVCVCR